MEVTVLDAQNTPQKPVIAIRVGSALRHAEMCVGTPFMVPQDDSQDGPERLKVTLYEQLGTQTIHDADESETFCNVPVRTPEGGFSQVKLRIRRGQGYSFNRSAIGAEDYLNHHQLEARIQHLFELVLKKQPENPYRCMIQELQKIRYPDGMPVPAVASMAPVAPSGPPPKNGRPSPAAKGRNYRPSCPEQTETDTRAALAEVMRTRGTANLMPIESTSLGNVRMASREVAARALSNLELAHEVMRLTMRKVVANMSMESSSMGLMRHDARFYAIAHAKNVELAKHVAKMVFSDAYCRLQARSAGMMCGGRTQSDETSLKKNSAEKAKHYALTRCVLDAAFTKAAWEF